MKTARRWTAEDDTRLTKMYAAGERSIEMAAQLDRTRSAIQMRAKFLGIAPTPMRGDQNPLWVAIVSLCADGVARSVRELADATGARYNTIEHLLRLRRDRGLAHIVSYAPPPWRGPHRPLWLPVCGTDAERPEPSERVRRRHELRVLAATVKPLVPAPSLRVQRRIGPAPRVIGAPQHEIIRAMYGMGVAA